MLITLTPDSHGELAHQNLGHVLHQARNLYSSGPGNAHELQAAYVTWATEARHSLRTFISSADIDRLITTPRFMAILALQVPVTGKHIVQLSALPGPMRGLISAEIDEHIRLLEAAMAELQRWNKRLKLLPGKLVVVDSSVYCHHPDRLDVWQPNQEIGAMPDDDVHLILPLPVLDELDRQKDRGQGGAATNARNTIRLLDRLLPQGLIRARGVEENPAFPHGSLTIDLWPDPDRHVRLPRADDEIVERAVAFQALAGRPVILLTGDVGMSTRARLRGLEARWLDMPDATHKPKKEPRGSQHPSRGSERPTTTAGHEEGPNAAGSAAGKG